MSGVVLTLGRSNLQKRIFNMNTNDKADIKSMMEEISRLKKERNALVLAHYYQFIEVQHAADFCGDSFELAKRARASDKNTIVFCGVKFMAESAKILNPDKKVFLPRHDAGCPMADMVTPEDILELRKKYPKAAVVCYINSSAATKAVCDICVTSSNAVRIVGGLKEDEIIFVPDKNLGAYVAKMLPEKTFHFHQGWCPTHKNLTEAAVLEAKAEYPDAPLAVHPECEEEVLRHAELIGSTSEILKFGHETSAKRVLIGTEMGVVERLTEECPEKEFILLSPCLVCPNMKKTSLHDLLNTLKNLEGEVIMTKEEIESAKLPLERMLEAGKVKA